MNLPSKKFKKINIKILATIGFLLLILCATNQAKADTFEEVIDDVTWQYEVEDNKAMNVRIKNETSYPTMITVPSTLGGYSVYSIGNGLNNIVNKQLIVSTGNVQGPNVYKVVLPNSVERINDNAFRGFHKMYDINFPTNLKVIGQDAFSNCAMLTFAGELRLPDSLETIGNYAFSMNLNRADEILDGWYAHWTLTHNFKTIVFGTNLTKIGDYAFELCPGITNISFPENIKTIGKGAFSYTKLETITFPNSDIKIGYNAFEYCRKIKKINIPSNLVDIGDYAFSNCSSLNEITFQPHTKKLAIGRHAFENCISLTNVTIIKNTELSWNVFENCINLTEATFEDTISGISNGTFKNCEKLVHVNKTASLTSIGEEAFYGCSSITTEEYNNIVDNITTIRSNAFANCTGLTGLIEVKSIVTQLGYGVFLNCTNIERVKFNAQLSYINDNLFKNCSKLKNIEYGSNITYIYNSAFENCISIGVNELNTEFLKGIIQIGGNAFNNCTGIKGKVVIPNTVTYIGEEAFSNCKNITDVEFPESLITIKSKAFLNTNEYYEMIEIPGENVRVENIIFNNVKDMYLRNTSTNTVGNMAGGYYETFIHLKNCKHLIDVVATLPGVTITNVGEEKASDSKYDCESNHRFKVNIEDVNAYPNLRIKMISQGDYRDSELVVSEIELDENNEFEINDLTRDKKIIVERIADGTNLVLRQFISSVNDIDVTTSRRPIVQTNDVNVIPYFQYNHTKQPVIADEDDIVTFNIRIYNEGDKAGKVNAVSVRLGEGISFYKNNEINNLYNWNLSEDERTITTNYLSEKEIPAYSAGRPEYEEIQYVCKVDKQSKPSEYIVTLAEISDGNNADSLPNSTTNIELEDYMKNEVTNSTKNTYLKGIENDTDIETIVLKEITQIGYNLVIKKIDSDTSELLDGAKFKLYNENKEEIKTGICKNGEIDFGGFTSYGEGTDTFYLEEVEVPIGYKRTFNGLLKLIVEKRINLLGEAEISIICDLKDFKIEEDIVEIVKLTNYIPIYTAEQLSKIGSGENIEISGKQYNFGIDSEYQLQNDIDLSENNWTPIPDFKGILDGNNHTISNLKITNANVVEGKETKIGLFGNVAGVVQNLNITGININIESNKIEEFNSKK